MRDIVIVEAARTPVGRFRGSFKGVRADHLGAAVLDAVVQRAGLQPGQIAMVGDRIYTDMMMAHRAGALGVLVLSGEATATEAAMADPPPHLTVPSLAEFGAALVQTHRPSSFA